LRRLIALVVDSLVGLPLLPKKFMTSHLPSAFATAVRPWCVVVFLLGPYECAMLRSIAMWSVVIASTDSISCGWRLREVCTTLQACDDVTDDVNLALPSALGTKKRCPTLMLPWQLQLLVGMKPSCQTGVSFPL